MKPSSNFTCGMKSRRSCKKCTNLMSKIVAANAFTAVSENSFTSLQLYQKMKCVDKNSFLMFSIYQCYQLLHDISTFLVLMTDASNN